MGKITIKNTMVFIQPVTYDNGYIGLKAQKDSKSFITIEPAHYADIGNLIDIILCDQSEHYALTADVSTARLIIDGLQSAINYIEEV